MSLKSETAREYRTRYPEKPSLALARIIYKENKALYKDVEDARQILRYIEGKKGAAAKKSLADKSMVLDTPRPYNPYKLPESDETAYEPFHISGHKRVAIFSDLHIPYHSIEAVTVALDFCKKEKPDALLLNGDALDFHTLSRFEKDPRKKNFKQEIDTFKAMMDVFKKVLKAKIYYKLGNHCERYEKYLQQKAGEIADLEEFDFANILKARAEGIEVIGDKRIMKLNELNGIHGHEFVNTAFSPVNVARGLYMRAKVSAFQGHNHQTSEHTEPDMNGKIITTWSLGCMCELHPQYMPINKWNLGFAMVDLDPNGHDYEFRNKRIFKGRVL
jgi:predicted phosphodiesterase